ncbi:S8 family serine peptidase [Marinimicrobium alkaliphilum]|uniref:S8 family serine peptidase n=1 Tax=Marinimicrobium alkaliphilum TaxID=2202654 RepID=UPI001E57BB1C|nr:S8 family serine peptidase [Marinimicrobium alkaliphilum]
MTPISGRRRLLQWSLCIGALVSQQAIAQAVVEQEEETPRSDRELQRAEPMERTAREREAQQIRNVEDIRAEREALEAEPIEAEARPNREREEREPEPAPEREPEPEPEPEPQPEPEREPEPEPQPEPEREPAPEPDIEPEPDHEPDAAPETPPEAEPEPSEPEARRPPMRRGGSLLNAAMTPPPVPVPPPRQITLDDASPDPDTLPHEPHELLLVSADMAEAQQAARQLQGYHLQVKSREQLDNLGLVISVLRLPPDIQVPALLAKLRAELPDLNLDTNQRYQPLNARRQYGQRMIRWPEPPHTCPSHFRIGLLDTQVADQHPALAGTALARRSFVRGESAPAEHGTAVASLLIGNPESLAPGLLPGSELFAAEVFRLRGTPDDPVVDTTTDTLLAALEWLASEQVQAINLSLGGERNRIFELALTQLLERDIRLIAAAGNQGPEAPPVFPAGQPGVIAVTAVDAAEQRYAEANRGDYIDLAAPGVDVWSADGDSEGRYHSGTSFAAPFATAALLLAEYQGVDLMQTAKDLGPEGRDDQFGWGLIQHSGCP